jgi:diguanylate cyclase (GGDEF)-like protein
MTERSTSEGILARLTALSNEFADILGGRVGEVRRIWAPVAKSTSLAVQRQALTQIHDIVHSLAGSGKSFGFPHVSMAAAPLDGLFRLLLEQNLALTTEEIAQIELLVQDLEKSTYGPREPISLDDIKADEWPDTSDRSGLRVLIAGSPIDLETQKLREAVIQFGYACDIAAMRAQVPTAILQGAATVLFADISTADDHLRALRQGSVLSQLPLIVASAQTGFAERLRAVRLGASMFVTKPYDMPDVIKLLTSLEEAQTQRSYRVVIAEDEKTLAQFYQMTLEHAGMDVRVVNEPSKLLDTISGFDPDLILMDVYMAGCTGLELAQIVRQFPAYTTVPILFLSTESRLELQLQARHFGGDDFLVKPLKPAQLVSAVMSRANRYNDLKKLTDRDSLTGLLNHTNILRDLEREISVAVRSGAPVSFCMVDIDHFKKVNDTYGHVVGDQVIIRVTHLLKNRLRRVDYVGRYGGEEFAVVMPNTDAVTACAVMNGLREASNAIEHQSGETTFKVTFSCGVATYPHFRTALALTEAADAALYKAKHGGRNQVVSAEIG